MVLLDIVFRQYI